MDGYISKVTKRVCFLVLVLATVQNGVHAPMKITSLSLIPEKMDEQRMSPLAVLGREMSSESQRSPWILKKPNVPHKRERTFSLFKMASSLPYFIRLYCMAILDYFLK